MRFAELNRLCPWMSLTATLSFMCIMTPPQRLTPEIRNMNDVCHSYLHLPARRWDSLPNDEAMVVLGSQVRPKYRGDEVSDQHADANRGCGGAERVWVNNIQN